MEIIEKVIDENSGKIFNFKIDICFLDRNCKVVYNNPLPVFSAEKLIGAVNLLVEDNVLVGNFAIDYSTPERLNIENNTSVFADPFLISKYDDKSGIEYWTISGVSLTSNV